MPRKVELDRLAELAFNAFVKGRDERRVGEDGKIRDRKAASFAALSEVSKQWWREVVLAITNELNREGS